MEEDMVTTFGFLQAVISIVLASGDVMKCILAGNRKIVFLLKQSIYFVSISSTNEPECILLKQLDFLYQKILFILTIKVHSILENNPATDLRTLLGSDSDRILRTACAGDAVPLPVAFHSLPTLVIEKSLREDVFGHLKVAVESSKAAMGLLLHDGNVFAIQNNPNIDLSIGTGDAILLANFITKSTVFKSQDQQYWVPICLPGFNAQGYLQAYVSTINIRDARDGIDGVAMFMVLIAVSNDPDSFKELIAGKMYMEKASRLPEINTRLTLELSSSVLNANKYRDQFDCLHFLYKMSPVQKKGSENKVGICQYIISDGKFPLHSTAEKESLFVEYEKLALRLRRGSTQWESTLFPAADVAVENKRNSLQDLIRPRKTSARYSPTFTKGDNIIATPEPSGKGNEPIDTSIAFEDGVNIMASFPSADHQLVSTTLNSGIVLVGLASYDCELFIAFPPTFGSLEASEKADNMMKHLKNQALAFLCTR